MNKFELLAQITQANEELDTYLSGLSEEEMNEPGPDGGWSAKDTLAHITAWMTMAAGWLESSLNGQPVQRYMPGYELVGDEEADEATMNRLNDHIYETHKGLSSDAILQAFDEASERLTAVVATMIEDDLFESGRLEWFPDHPVWLNIAGNSFLHIRDHLAEFKSQDAPLED